MTPPARSWPRTRASSPRRSGPSSPSTGQPPSLVRVAGTARSPGRSRRAGRPAARVRSGEIGPDPLDQSRSTYSVAIGSTGTCSHGTLPRELKVQLPHRPLLQGARSRLRRAAQRLVRNVTASRAKSSTTRCCRSRWPRPTPSPTPRRRRLFYVALTRARRHVTLIGVQGRESAFVAELLKDKRLELSPLSTVDLSEPCPTCGRGVWSSGDAGPTAASSWAAASSRLAPSPVALTRRPPRSQGLDRNPN